MPTSILMSKISFMKFLPPVTSRGKWVVLGQLKKIIQKKNLW